VRATIGGALLGTVALAWISAAVVLGTVPNTHWTSKPILGLLAAGGASLIAAVFVLGADRPTRRGFARVKRFVGEVSSGFAYSEAPGVAPVFPPSRFASGPLRVALIAVRSELATCAIRIGEALDGGRWWNPQQELPGTEWRERMADLADPSLAPELHQKMERAYQQCGALNLRIRRYLIEYREGQQPMLVALTTIPASVYQLRDEDRDVLTKARQTIGIANAAISIRIDGGQT
jgi:hypothetical protein